ncbi:hypothetical protein WMF31_41170 [Sorangium sp. So ce1036]|uniref:hypothetical protein n=1 Tax=Sorangium sp. So ce1036 TaxID=3133328 RepID=UPI003F115C74
MLHGSLYVDSIRPPRPRSLRPWYLVATMLLTWIIGVRGFMAGCGTAMYLRSGMAPDVTAVAEQARDQGDPFQFTFAVLEAAQAHAMSAHQDVAFPLSIAKVLLGGLLVVASGLALGGRPGTRGFVLQVLAANLAFAAVEYALTRDVRGAWIDMVAQAGALLPPGVPEREGLTNPGLWWTAERVRFVLFELCILGFAALALTRERTKLYFQAVARATDPGDEP